MVSKNPNLKKKITKRIRERAKELYPGKVFFSRKEAAKIKGVAYGTLSGRHHYQPKGGKGDLLLRGRPYWEIESILEWALVGDSDRRKYLESYGWTEEKFQQVNKSTEKSYLIKKPVVDGLE